MAYKTDMDIALIKRAGEALFGNQWQTPLAEALGVSDRTMRRWVSGETPVPTGVLDDIERAAHGRVADIYAFMAELNAARSQKS